MSTAVRSISKLGFVVAALSLLCVASAVAQDPGTTTTIRATTRLVQLNVVVVGKDGAPVSGLTQDDFHVFDNGREQKLVHFAVSTSSENSARAPESPLVVSNRSPNQAQSPRTVTVILVDEMIDQELEATDLRNVVEQGRLGVLKFLRTVQPGEQIAIYALRPEGVAVIHDFTDNSEALVAAAKKLGTGLLRSKIHRAPLSPTQASALASSSYGQGLQSNNDALTEQVHQVIVDDAFNAVAEQLRYLPGRKNLVWISATFPMVVADFNPAVMMQERTTAEPAPGAIGPLPVPQYAWPQNYTDQLTRLARSLSNANIAVYPIDPRGLLSPQGLKGGAEISSGESNKGGPPPALPSVAPFTTQWGAMDLIASETGGRAFYDANGIVSALRDVMDENHVAYILGYYPGDKEWDGKYHKVVIRVDRRGSNVRCRKGYFAKDDPPEGPDPVLRQAAKSLIENAGIEVTLNVATNPLRWFNQDVVLKVHAQDLHFQKADERYNDHLEVAFVQIDKDGLIVDGIKDEVNLALLPATYDQALDLGWLYPRNLWISPAAEKLRVLVRDVGSGSMGSVSVSVHDQF